MWQAWAAIGAVLLFVLFLGGLTLLVWPRKITAQDLFDQVWEHFVVYQNPPSMSEGAGKCLYRGPNGTKCAAGLLFPDRVYDPKMEQVLGAVDEMATKFPAVLKYIPVQYMDLARALQTAHDRAAHKVAANQTGTFTELVESNLRNVAKDFGLQVPIENDWV